MNAKEFPPEKPPQDKTCCCYVPKRYVVTCMLFFGMLITHAQRVNIAVTAVTILDKNVHGKVGPGEPMMSIPSVHWSSEMVGFLHAVFYIGYILTQLPGGYLCTIYHSHRIFGGCIVFSCALNLCLPVSINRLGFAVTCTVRALQGLAEGLLFPACYSVLSRWTVSDEKSSAGALVLTGVYVGPFIGLTVSGAVTHYYGWYYVYYLHGLVGVFWFVFWIFLSYERPEDHPTISEDEAKYLEKQQGATVTQCKNDRVPWTAIFTSLPVIALCVANFARSFVFFFLLTNEPAYVNTFNFTLAQNGVFSALPHALMAAVCLLSGPLADRLISSRHLTTTEVRKSFTCVGFGMEAACFLLLSFVEDGVAAIVFLTLGVGFSGVTISGWQINHLDLAPRYASVLVALTTACGTVAGIVNPPIVGAMTKDMSLDSWQNVFLLITAVLAICVVFYAIYGSGELQPWAQLAGHVRVVHPVSPLDKQPYGTFHQQDGATDDTEHEAVTDADTAAETSNSRRSETSDTEPS